MIRRIFGFLMALFMLPGSFGCGGGTGGDDGVDPLKRKIWQDGAYPVELRVDVPDWGEFQLRASPDEKTIFVLGTKSQLVAFDVESGTPEQVGELVLPGFGYSSRNHDLELWGEDRLVVIAGRHFYIVDVSDPPHLTILASALLPAFYGDTGLPAQPEPSLEEASKLLGRGCILDERYLFVSRTLSKCHVWRVALLGSLDSGGVDVIDLQRISGDMGIIQPDYHLETPWLSPSDCVSFNDWDRAYLSDDDGHGYWPIPPEAVIGVLGTELSGKIVTILSEGLTSGDLSGLGWVPPQMGAGQPEKLDNLLQNLRSFYQVMGVDNITNGYTADILAPNDPPGPFALVHPELAGAERTRGNGPIYVAISPESLGLLNAFTQALLGNPPNPELALLILLGDLRPYYCWESNPLKGGANDFESESVQCVLVLPRYGIEGLLYYYEVIEGSKATFEEALAPLHEILLQFAGYPGDIPAAAATLGSYNVQLCREYTWYYNRVSQGMPINNHMIDFSDPSGLSEFVPAPTWPTSKALLNQIAAAIEAAATADLAAGGELSRDPARLIPDDFASEALPIDFGSDYAYPVASESDPAAAGYGVKQGKHILTWGTPGLSIETKLLAFGGEKIMPVPGSNYMLATSVMVVRGWDILRASAEQPLSNAYHVGMPFPTSMSSDTEALSLPIRVEKNIPFLGGFEDALPGDGIGLDSRTMVLVDIGDEDFAAPRDGKVYVMDISRIESGAAPIELWSGAMEPGSRLVSAVGLPKAGLIFVIGATVDGQGNVKEYKLWRIATDMPYTY